MLESMELGSRIHYIEEFRAYYTDSELIEAILFIQSCTMAVYTCDGDLSTIILGLVVVFYTICS